MWTERLLGFWLSRRRFIAQCFHAGKPTWKLFALACVLYLGLHLALSRSIWVSTRNYLLDRTGRQMPSESKTDDSYLARKAPSIRADSGENLQTWEAERHEQDPSPAVLSSLKYRPYYYVGDNGWRQRATCAELVSGKSVARKWVKSYLSDHPPHMPDSEDIIEATANCSRFRRRYNYRQTPASEEEARYPIAYSLMIYKDAAQFEMLLRAIYHPQNVHCIHVDQKADSMFKRAIKGLASCLENVFLTSNPIDVVYGGISRLEADFSCMRDLLRSKVPWKYLINLTGQEFPLKTNFEIMKILKSLRGNTDLDVNMPTLQNQLWRFVNHWEIVDSAEGKMFIERENDTKESPPDGVRLAKGGAYGIFGRNFLSYALSLPPEVQRFLDWSSDIWSPDEVFWATIYMRKYNPIFKSPGGYDGNQGNATYKNFLAKFVVWQVAGEKEKCFGRFVRMVCVFSSAAIPTLIEQPEIFANKFNVHMDHAIVNCLGEWLHNKTLNQPSFQTDYYEDFTKRYFE